MHAHSARLNSWPISSLKTSAAHGASASLAKLLWLAQTPAGKQARYALHQADWLLGRLCGRYGISDENNALKLGYDIIRRRWPDWLAQLDIPTVPVSGGGSGGPGHRPAE